MNCSPILIVHGEPNSVFLEILFKTLKIKTIKSPIILISSEKILSSQMKKFKFKKKINKLDINNLSFKNLNNKSINLININFAQKKTFEKISNKSKKFIEKSFEIAFEIIKNKKISKFINGPISKKHFLNHKYLGITEYISAKFSVKKTCMLIYNKELSVCPVTTHLPLKQVVKNLNKKSISEKIFLIDSFYKNNFGYKPKIGILGVNPHCESIDKFDEDKKIINPVIKTLKKKYKVSGPYPADTIFIKKMRQKFDVIVGMYHDQVLTPIKTIYEYNAINITLGLPFLRVSPDHGPNEKMLGKNLSNPSSLIQAINFLDNN
tara:strand:- start:1446 stop:2408 length:963 start_codon:yes stop_codon:yes gene_type:complete